MKLIAKLGALFLVLINMTACNSQESNTATTETLLDINAFEAKYQKTPGAILIDVRTPEEYADGHLESASVINYKGSDFESQLKTLDKSKPTFIYCRSGRRSGAAFKIFKKLGFKEVYDMKGGFLAWTAAGKKTTK